MKKFATISAGTSLAAAALLLAAPFALAQDTQDRPTLNKDKQPAQQPASTTLSLETPGAADFVRRRHRVQDATSDAGRFGAESPAETRRRRSVFAKISAKPVSLGDLSLHDHRLHAGWQIRQRTRVWRQGARNQSERRNDDGHSQPDDSARHQFERAGCPEEAGESGNARQTRRRSYTHPAKTERHDRRGICQYKKPNAGHGAWRYWSCRLASREICRRDSGAGRICKTRHRRRPCELADSRRRQSKHFAF